MTRGNRSSGTPVRHLQRPLKVKSDFRRREQTVVLYSHARECAEPVRQKCRCRLPLYVADQIGQSFAKGVSSALPARSSAILMPEVIRIRARQYEYFNKIVFLQSDAAFGALRHVTTGNRRAALSTVVGDAGWPSRPAAAECGAMMRGCRGSNRVQPLKDFRTATPWRRGFVGRAICRGVVKQVPTNQEPIQVRSLKDTLAIAASDNGSLKGRARFLRGSPRRARP